MRRSILVVMLVISLSPCLLAQERNELIINPKLEGGLGMMPLIPTKIVNMDTMPPGWKPDSRNKIYKMKDLIPPNAGPVSLLITGMVPDPSRRYVVAITKDEAEFQQAFPEYKRLIAQGKYMDAAKVLCISEHMAVSTKVESFRGDTKTADMPEKVGSFFFDLDVIALRKYGGCLTFLSYQPKVGDDVVDFGYGLSDTIHGVLMIEELPAKEGGKPEYTMGIIKAKVTQ